MVLKDEPLQQSQQPPPRKTFTSIADKFKGKLLESKGSCLMGLDSCNSLDINMKFSQNLLDLDPKARETIKGHDFTASESLKMLASEKAGGMEKI